MQRSVAHSNSCKTRIEQYAKLVTNEPLESWEILLYPVLCFVTIAFYAQPIQWYFSSLWRWDIALFVGISIFEIYRHRKTRPGLARCTIIGASTAIGWVFFTGQNHQVMYFIVLCLFAYLWVLEHGFKLLFDRIQMLLKSRRKKE